MICGAHVSRSATSISLEGVSKTFSVTHERRTILEEHVLHPFRNIDCEEQVALDDVTFSVSPGEFFGVIGANGSGKSTLLRVIAGIDRQDCGTVLVEGRLSPLIELGVSFNYELTARDNIRINGTLLGLMARELERRFNDVALAEVATGAVS
jgi:ABC-type polysaccharide/polyol phosphate transport system ATPase subunit